MDKQWILYTVWSIKIRELIEQRLEPDVFSKAVIETVREKDREFDTVLPKEILVVK